MSSEIFPSDPDDWGFEQDTSHVVWEGQEPQGIIDPIQEVKQDAALQLEMIMMKFQVSLGDSLDRLKNVMNEMSEKFKDLHGAMEQINIAEQQYVNDSIENLEDALASGTFSESSIEMPMDREEPGSDGSQ